MISVDQGCLSSSITVQFMSNAEKEEYISIDSSALRELSFVAHHGVHHIAMMKLMMSYMNYSNLPSVGIAISTTAHKTGKK